MKHLSFLTLATALVLLGSGCAKNSDNTTPVASNSPPARSTEPSLATEDRTYLQLMARHEKYGLLLAQDAQRQATDKSLKQLADQFVSEQNEALRKLEGLGAVIPDGRENAEQEERSLASAKPESGAPTQTVTDVGPGTVAPGTESYDLRWKKTYLELDQKGLELARQHQGKLKNQGLQQWNDELLKRDQAQLDQVTALRP